MLLKFVNENENISLPLKATLTKLKAASETELRVLLYAAAISADKGAFDENDIKKLSGLDSTEIIIALQFWRGAEVLAIASENDTRTTPATERTLQKNDTPTYSGEEIAKLFDEKGELRLLVDECQKIAGKVFNPHEINKIVSLYDYLGLSSEYILSVYAYCKSKNKTTVHYIEKTAFNLYNEGVDTDEKLQEYLKRKEEFDSVAGNIRRIFGLGSRSLTKKEEELIKKWTDVYCFDIDLIEYSYELTINAIEKPSLSYAGKIMENWFKAGIKTLDEAKNSEAEYKNASKPSTQEAPSSSFDTDEFFEAALKRSYENIGKQQNN